MRVVIAEDLALMREGIASLLTDAGNQVVATVADGDALLEAAAEHSRTSPSSTCACRPTPSTRA